MYIHFIHSYVAVEYVLIFCFYILYLVHSWWCRSRVRFFWGRIAVLVMCTCMCKIHVWICMLCNDQIRMYITVWSRGDSLFQNCREKKNWRKWADVESGALLGKKLISQTRMHMYESQWFAVSELQRCKHIYIYIYTDVFIRYTYRSVLKVNEIHPCIWVVNSNTWVPNLQKKISDESEKVNEAAHCLYINRYGSQTSYTCKPRKKHDVHWK